MLVQLLVAAVLGTNPLPDRNIGHCQAIEQNIVFKYDPLTQKYNVMLDQIIAYEGPVAVDWIHTREVKSVYRLGGSSYMIVLNNDRIIITKCLDTSFTDFDKEVKDRGIQKPIFSRWSTLEP